MTRPLDVRGYFRQEFGYLPVHVVRAPGRLELLGNHTDYNQGLALALAIDRYVFAAIAPRDDGRVEIVSSTFPGQREAFWIAEFKPGAERPWANYVKGVLDRLRRRNVHFTGFNLALHSTIPLGAGLGSSGALQVAVALAVRELRPYKLTEAGAGPAPKRDTRGALPELKHRDRLNLARLCQEADHEFIGVRSGMLDQLASLCGKAFHAVEIDFMHGSATRVPMIGEVAVVVCPSGVSHAHAGGQYNELRKLCESAATRLGVRSLRQVETSDLPAARSKLPPREFDCVHHIVGETQRVIHGAQALREDDFVQFGHLMYLSHESSRDRFQNSCRELDLLVDLAKAHPGCLGARLTGGGFGGATINLVRLAELDDFRDFVRRHYERATHRKMTPEICKVVDGADTEGRRSGKHRVWTE
jgi:galactokinase